MMYNIKNASTHNILNSPPPKVPMDIDIDWCLTCNKRTDGIEPYCSYDCQIGAGPSTCHQSPPSNYSLHYYRAREDGQPQRANYQYDDDEYFEKVSNACWVGRGFSGIRAWAADIPPGAQPDVDYSSELDAADDTFSLANVSTTSSNSSNCRAPNLVRPSRPLPPSLTMSKPELSVATAAPWLAPLEKHFSTPNSPRSSARTSILSDDSLPTPTSTNTMPFSGRVFPSISDDRANDIAACTQPLRRSSSSSLSLPFPHENSEKLYVPCRGQPPSGDVFSLSQSSIDDWWTTDFTVDKYVTRNAGIPLPTSIRKDLGMPSGMMRGLRSSRVAA